MEDKGATEISSLLCKTLVFVFILTPSLNTASGSKYVNNSIDMWFHRKSLFIFFSSELLSVKKSVSVTEGSLMGSVRISIVRLHKGCARK